MLTYLSLFIPKWRLKERSEPDTVSPAHYIFPVNAMSSSLPLIVLPSTVAYFTCRRRITNSLTLPSRPHNLALACVPKFCLSDYVLSETPHWPHLTAHPFTKCFHLLDHWVAHFIHILHTPPYNSPEIRLDIRN